VLELLTTCFMAIQNWFFLFRDNISIIPYTSIFETVFLHLRSATILHIIYEKAQRGTLNKLIVLKYCTLKV